MHLAALPGLKPHGGARRDIKASPPCRITVKFQGRVGLGEMVMASHLNGAITGVGNHQGDPIGPRIKAQLPLRRDHLTGDHLRTLRATAPTTATARSTRPTLHASIPCGWAWIPSCAKAGLANTISVRAYLMSIS